MNSDLSLKMTTMEKAVFRIISSRRGRDKAIAANDIAKFTEISAREVRRIIRNLRLKHGKPIGSATGRPPGYYIAKSVDELLNASYPFKRFGLKSLVVWYRMMKISRAEFIGQINLELATELSEES